MDEYLDEEVESVKAAFETICRGWERKVCRGTGSVIQDLSRQALWSSWLVSRRRPRLTKRPASSIPIIPHS